MIVDYKELEIKNYKNELLDITEVEHDLDTNPFGKYLIYLEDNEIVGFLYYSDIYDRAEINQIEVLVPHRNCGKASKLIEKMISLVEKSITLEVKIDNIPAINLYKKYNFVEKAIRQGYYNGTDGILMERTNK